jgi:hypothetical protein
VLHHPFVTRRFEEQLSLTDADWPTAQDGEKPVAAAGGTRTFDPLLSFPLSESRH